MSTELDIAFMELQDHEFSIPCEYDRLLFCGGGDAKWVAYCRCEACGYRGQRIICTYCKDRLLRMTSGVRCPNDGCEERYVPARRAFERFEHL